jgi:HlyD family secretion protein
MLTNIRQGEEMDRIIEKKKSKKYIWFALIGSVLLILILQIIFGDKSSKYRIERERLSIEEVKTGIFQDYISVTGTVQPRQVVYLDAIEGGYVEEILIREGAFVQKGEIIMRLSNTNLHLSIMNHEASLSEQMNNLRNTRLLMEQTKLDIKQQLLELDFLLNKAERDFTHNQDLFEKKFISNEQFLQYKEQYEYYEKRKELLLERQEQDELFRRVQVEQLEDSVERMKNNLDLVRQKLESLQVKAPVQGQLTSINAQIGQAIAAGERLGQINDMENFILNAEIDEYYISRLQIGLSGSFDFSGNTYEISVSRIFPEVRNGRFSIELVFSNAIPEGLRAGQTFRVRLELGDAKEALLISRGGFYQSTGGRWIFVLDENGQIAERRDIRLGRMNPAYFEVTDGLQAGEKVIISSYENFQDIEKLVIK